MRKGLSIAAVLAASLALGFTLCTVRYRTAFRELTSIQPVETSPLAPNEAHYFHIVGLEKGEPKVVVLDELNPDGSHESVETFYIPKGDLADITKRLNQSLAGEFDTNIKVEIQRDDPQTRSQRIHTHFHSDDFTYESVYDADDHSAKPVAYGDTVKRDGVQALRPAIPLFIGSVVVGIILAILTAVFMRSRPPQPPPRAPRPRS
jgi:hypothetical protein